MIIARAAYGAILRRIRSHISTIYTHITMRKYALHIIGAATALGIVFGFGTAFAGEDEQAKIRNRIDQLTREIERNGQEYQGISASIAEDRARCDLAKAKEAQLSRLNGANNAKRTEIEILSNLLLDDNSAVNLGK